jgi:hypothetical protein
MESSAKIAYKKGSPDFFLGCLFFILLLWPFHSSVSFSS